MQARERPIGQAETTRLCSGEDCVVERRGNNWLSPADYWLLRSLDPWPSTDLSHATSNSLLWNFAAISQWSTLTSTFAGWRPILQKVIDLIFVCTTWTPAELHGVESWMNKLLFSDCQAQTTFHIFLSNCKAQQCKMLKLKCLWPSLRILNTTDHLINLEPCANKFWHFCWIELISLAKSSSNIFLWSLAFPLRLDKDDIFRPDPETAFLTSVRYQLIPHLWWNCNVWLPIF